MNRFTILIIVFLIGFTSILVGFGSQPSEKLSQEGFPKEPCIEEGSPITSEDVSFNGLQYSLIKKNARVPGPNPKTGEEDKFQNGMEKIGSTSNNKNVYKIKTTNYFGEPNNNDIIYVLEEQKEGSSYFNIYIKNGAQIPDSIKNCKTTGGTIAVDQNSIGFPPSGFNTLQVTGLRPGLLDAPAYIYNGTKKAFPQVDVISGVEKNIGSITVEGKSYHLYFHLGTVYVINNNDAYEYLPSAASLEFSTEKNALQIKKIEFIKTPFYSWWTPECKPAIYLYPQKGETVTVKVTPKGFFTLAIPKYPKNGWQVTAFPDGTIKAQDKTYPYLYYESKINDSAIMKPTKGFVVRYEKLSELYDNLLPKLGLSQKEVLDFKEYWERVLPYSGYYFVGVMDRKSIDTVETLEVDPEPETIIRVRLYFEPLDREITVKTPDITTPERRGFVLSEWGGMVKIDKDHPFTCSQ